MNGINEIQFGLQRNMTRGKYVQKTFYLFENKHAKNVYFRMDV